MYGEAYTVGHVIRLLSQAPQNAMCRLRGHDEAIGIEVIDNEVVLSPMDVRPRETDHAGDCE